MNLWSSYAAVPLRLAVGGVFLHHGIMRLQVGLPGTAAYLHSVGVPFANIFAVILIGVEVVGGALTILGILTRIWGLCFVVEMVAAIVRVKLPGHVNFELQALLLAGAASLVALGDGPLALGMSLKRG
ncbi:MAG TPA: DoxX family protein [Gemmatimonadales bacterium]|nr:DoxX family protein [Gemmatimonadales bacterium]